MTYLQFLWVRTDNVGQLLALLEQDKRRHLDKIKLNDKIKSTMIYDIPL